MKSIHSTIDPVLPLPRRVSLTDKPATAKLTLGEARKHGPVLPAPGTLTCARCGYHSCSCPPLTVGNIAVGSVTSKVLPFEAPRASKQIGVRCKCGNDAWFPLEGVAFGFKCMVCARFIVSYTPGTEYVVPERAPWPPKSPGIAESIPPEQRWRGSVLGLGEYALEPNVSHRSYLTPHFGFLPKRFRITANGPGVRVQVVIQDRCQYRPANNHYTPGTDGGIPQELFEEDGVNDKIDPILRQAKVEVFTYNSAAEHRQGYAWFEGEKVEENW